MIDEPRLDDLITAVAVGSDNDGVQITTYTSGRTQVHWVNDGIHSADGPTLKQALKNAIIEQADQNKDRT